MHPPRSLLVLSVLSTACPTASSPGESTVVERPTAHSPSQSATTAAPAQQPAPPSPQQPPLRFGVTAQDAKTLCAEIIDMDDTPLISCAFVDGYAFDNGARIDVIELEYDEAHQGQRKEAYLVLRYDEFPATEQIGYAYQVAGEEVDYELGKLAVEGSRVTLRARLVTTTFPNTGDDGADHVELVEATTVTFTCEFNADDASCERDELDEDSQAGP